ncbi:MAG: hypothetical protein KR126chlam4_01199 [Candidatus Anoxychlamydiales bacterium]|uniref:FeoB-associated Cys-rich membrane protein n=1 Tax=marine sediment metagenome TaxID=412755 RepID=A0A0F9IQZ8_9ZZZZ|nr:hypothetical protein [Candidatus Anoxychlamydiales bacterium]
MIDKFLVILIIGVTLFLMLYSTYKTFNRGTKCSNCRYNSKKKQSNPLNK